MAKYGEKNVILDLGFVDGCVRSNVPSETLLLECLHEALDQLENEALSAGPNSRRMIHNLGFIRGMIWKIPMPGAYSDAMDRLMEYLVEGTTDWYQLPQPFTGREHEDPVLPDELRDEIYTDYAIEGREYAAETARRAGFEKEFIIDRIVPPRHRPPAEVPVPRGGGNDELAALDLTEFDRPQANAPGVVAIPSSVSPERKLGSPATTKREWTPERRAEASERAKGQRKPPFDSDLEAVKRDFDSGMAMSAIGRKWGCSDAHIRNFLTKHGIDPRRSEAGNHAGRPPLSDKEVQLIIAEKAKGTPSKEIGDIIGRSQHAVDQKYSDFKKAGLVPEEHLSPEAMAERRRLKNELVSQKMRVHHARKHAEIDQPGPHVDDSDAEGYSEAELSSETPATPPASQPTPTLTAEDSHVLDEEWPDIQRMLASGSSREKIAGDYDVPMAELNAFIGRKLEAARQRRAAKDSPPGEAPASLASLAGGALH